MGRARLHTAGQGGPHLKGRRAQQEHGRQLCRHLGENVPGKVAASAEPPGWMPAGVLAGTSASVSSAGVPGEWEGQAAGGQAGDSIICSLCTWGAPCR